MAGDERDLGGDAAVGDGDPRRGRGGADRRDPGDDLERDRRRRERERLLAASPEDERVASLEPDDLEALPAELDEQLVQLDLPHVLARDQEGARGRLLDELG